MKHLLFIITLLFSTMSVHAQTFVEEGKHWTYRWATPIGDGNEKFSHVYLQGDTLIGGNGCIKLYEEYEAGKTAYSGALYEHAGKVYIYPAETEQAQLLYDFTLKAGDTTRILDRDMEVLSIHTETYEGIERRVFDMLDEYGETGLWIEGIGSTSGLDCPVSTPGNYFQLYTCMSAQGVIYQQSASGVHDVPAAVQNPTAIYNLSGYRMNGVPAKGIYIRNGKKILSK